MSRNSFVVRSPFVAALLTLAAAGAPVSAQLPLGEPILVNSATQAGDQQLPALGMADDGRFRVVWTEGSPLDVRMRAFAADGSPFNATLIAQDDSAEFDARISVNGSGDFIAAWGSNNVDDGGLDLFGRRSTNNGSTLANEGQLNAAAAIDVQLPSAVSRSDDDSFVAVWRDDDAPGELFFRKFGADGTPLTGDVIANEITDPDLEDFDVAAAPEGGFLIVWQGNESPNQNVFGRCFDAAGAPIGGQFPVPVEAAPRNLHPLVGVDGTGSYVVAWVEGGSTDIEWRRIGADCEPEGGDRLAIAGGAAGNLSVELDVADDGAIFLTWRSTEIDLDGGVSALELTKSGAVVGGEFLVHDAAAGGQFESSIGAGDRLFAVAWQDQEGTTGGDDDIYARRFLRRVVFTDDFESADLVYWTTSEP